MTIGRNLEIYWRNYLSSANRRMPGRSAKNCLSYRRSVIAHVHSPNYSSNLDNARKIMLQIYGKASPETEAPLSLLEINRTKHGEPYYKSETI